VGTFLRHSVYSVKTFLTYRVMPGMSPAPWLQLVVVTRGNRGALTVTYGQG